MFRTNYSIINELRTSDISRRIDNFVHKYSEVSKMSAKRIILNLSHLRTIERSKSIILIRNIVWIMIFFSIIFVSFSAEKTAKIYSKKFEESFIKHQMNSKTNNDEISKKNSNNQVPCKKRIKKILFYLIDNFGYRAALLNQHDYELKLLFDQIRSNNIRGRFFRVNTDNFLLTNGALRRMFIGYRCSIMEGYNNYSPLNNISNYSIFTELSKHGLTSKVHGNKLWEVLFKSDKLNLEFTRSEEIDDIMESFRTHDLTIVHSGLYDIKCHLYDCDSDDAKKKLKYYINKFNSIVERINASDEDTLIILTGDHGSFLYNHGFETKVESTMPMFALTNFDGFFTTKHLPIMDRERNYIFEIDQLDFGPTLALLFGTQVNEASEGRLIGEFFRDYNSGLHIESCYQHNVNHLKQVIDKRQFYQNSQYKLNLDGNESLKSLEKKYADFITDLPKNDVRMLKNVIVLSISLLLVSILGRTIFSIVFSLSFIICGVSLVEESFLIFTIALPVLSLVNVFLSFGHIRIIFIDYESRFFNQNNAFIIVKIFAIISAIIPFTSYAYSSFLRIVVFNVFFVVPSMYIVVFVISIRSSLKLLIKLQLCLVMAISGCFVIFMKISPNYKNQIYTYFEVDSIGAKLMCLFVPIITLLQLKTTAKQSNLSIKKLIYYFGLLCLIYIIWIFRDVLNQYKTSTRKRFVHLVYFVHLYALIPIIAGLIEAYIKKDVSVFYESSFFSIISITLAMYDLNYCVFFIAFVVVVRSIGSIPRMIERSIRSSGIRLQLKSINIVRNIILFYFIFFDENMNLILFSLLGRDYSLHDLFDSSLAFKFTIKEEDNYYAKFYGIAIAFTPMIISSFFVSFELIRYILEIKKTQMMMTNNEINELAKDNTFSDEIHKLSNKNSHRSLKRFFNTYLNIVDRLFESLCCWYSALILFHNLKLYYRSINNPQHLWNDTELKISVIILKCLMKLLIFHCNAALISAII